MTGQRQRVPSATLVVAIGLVYFPAGRFGLALAFDNPNVSGIWPASGIALAACLLVGNRVLPGDLRRGLRGLHPDLPRGRPRRW